MMNYPDINQSILQDITTESWKAKGLEVFVKRDDLIHDIISGNKWRKLIYNIEQAQLKKNECIITFGGAFSNHLVATACAAKMHNLKSVGIVRGEELNENSNATLRKCAELGMQLVFVSRELYNLRNDYQWRDELRLEHTNSFIVPEGGSNFYGILGCQEIWNELPKDIDRVFIAQGTTTTSCGLVLGAPEKTKIDCVPVLKGFDSLSEMNTQLATFFLDEETLQDLQEKIIIHDQYHFGGYGKYSPELLVFIQEKYKQLGIKLDPIYTGKAFYAMEEYLNLESTKNQKVVFIHTGGIQGSKGIEGKENIELYA